VLADNVAALLCCRIGRGVSFQVGKKEKPDRGVYGRIPTGTYHVCESQLPPNGGARICRYPGNTTKSGSP